MPECGLAYMRDRELASCCAGLWAQTTLHGCKVSLSEVEAALMACAGVEAAVALVTDDFGGAQRLVVRIP